MALTKTYVSMPGAVMVFGETTFDTNAATINCGLSRVYWVQIMPLAAPTAASTVYTNMTLSNGILTLTDTTIGDRTVRYMVIGTL